MKRSWSFYFSFNRRERRGVITLTFLNLCALCALAFKERLPIQSPLPAMGLRKWEVVFPSVSGPSSVTVEPPVKRIRMKGKIVELNTADSAVLVSLKGIGPSFARRILRYRERLGGFHTLEQLMEVYGMDKERFTLLSEQVSVDSSRIRRLNINTLPADSLRVHPYIRWNLANLIVKYREKHGFYREIGDLKHLDLVTDSIYCKLAPYCKVQ
ncbi:MAG: helix-hairpin-helix domain-containing protein [Bacteroidia bacterium]|nr:helix-hairpin-helix domain-containing protein [Bacteroidia bacterium]